MTDYRIITSEGRITILDPLCYISITFAQDDLFGRINSEVIIDSYAFEQEGYDPEALGRSIQALRSYAIAHYPQCFAALYESPLLND